VTGGKMVNLGNRVVRAESVEGSAVAVKSLEGHFLQGEKYFDIFAFVFSFDR
jgi:hypothetical protein